MTNTGAIGGDSGQSPVELAELALALAVGAGDLARELLAGAAGGPLSTRTKSSATDPVTEIDTAVERELRDRLRELRADDLVLGEEEGGTRPPPGVVQWVIDPIDGTVNLLYGLPFSAVSIAAVRDGRTLAGAVHVVADGRTYRAAAGAGAHVVEPDGSTRPLRASAATDLPLALVGTGFSYSAVERERQAQVLAHVLPRVRDIRRLGAAAIDLCLVGAGVLDAYYERCLKPWDHAAGALVAAEAGAVVRVAADDGQPTVAVAPGMAGAFLDLLDEAGRSVSS